jgi:hypothetical protein
MDQLMVIQFTPFLIRERSSRMYDLYRLLEPK